MGESAHSVVQLKDYQPPVYRVDHVELTFDLDPAATRVTSRMRLHRADGLDSDPPLRLHGHHLTLVSVRLDDRLLAPEDYVQDDQSLTIPHVATHFILELETVLHPAANTSLEGLYLSNALLCTQCEAEGFRRITYFPDRPDVMSSFRTTLIAHRQDFPVLLANGNLTASGMAGAERHFATWEDPFPKPCYLFALVAGNLACQKESFTTRSGKKVALELYVEPANQGRGGHALAALKKAMAWDEQRFGREYDLNIYMIAAVNDFNAGAMENKGLNIFNSKYVLADPQIATDDDYDAIEAVIAHEYFHNWTGNRITCRDWFQLSLKEGLTVFREQLFSEEEGLAAVVRVRSVRGLRTFQFQEDAGPMAHPVQPASYMEINNFYTSTVYDKGAEVARMLWILCGEQGFRRGMDLYFQRHDGQAVTIQDLVACMATATGRDFSQFLLWYSQAGTPVVQASGQYDPHQKCYTLTLRQSCPPTPGQPEKWPMHIPVSVALLDGQGQPHPLQLAGEDEGAVTTQRVLELCQERQEFRFLQVDTPPVPSLLRGFSAPVRLEMAYSEEELAFLWAQDTDPFCRWEAGQRLAMRLLMSAIGRWPDDVQAGYPEPSVLNETIPDAFAKTLANPHIAPAMAALSLSLPSEGYLLDQMTIANPQAVHQVRKTICQTLAHRLHNHFLAAYRLHHRQEPYQYSPAAAGHRSLKNLCLDYLMSINGPEERRLALQQFHQADNMTDRLRALTALAHNPGPEQGEVLALFFEKWRHEPLVVNKWLTIQATAPLTGTLQQVQSLLDHPAYNAKNPNNVRALVGAFASSNPLCFHQPDGAGYRFLAQRVLETDPVNPHLAARLAGAFRSWKRFDESRRTAMKRALAEMVATPGLSRDVTEVVSKLLG